MIIRRRTFLAGSSVAGLATLAPPLATRSIAAPAPLPTHPIAADTDRWRSVPQIRRNLTQVSRDSALWSSAARIDEHRRLFHNQVTDEPVIVRLAHDANVLFVMVEHNGDPATRNLRGIDLVFPSPSGSACRVAEIGFIEEEGPKERMNYLLPTEPLTAAQHTVVAADGSTSTTMEIPLTEISNSNALGTVIGFNIVVRHHRWTRPLTSWQTVRRSVSWHRGTGFDSYGVDLDLANQGRYGLLVLDKTPTDRTTQVDLLDQAELTLGYRSHRIAELDVNGLPAGLDTVHLRWRTPDGAWRPLGSASVVGTSVTSHHIDHGGITVDGLYTIHVSTNESFDLTSGSHGFISFDRDSVVQAGNSQWSQR